MNQTKENKQTILLILIDLFICVVSYLLGGYLWLTFYHNLTVAQIVQDYDVQMLLFENLPVILILYLAAILLFNVENGFIRRSNARVLWASLKSGVIMLLTEALIVFVRIRSMPDASRGTYICIAVVNLILFFAVHMLLRYYLLKVHRNMKNVPQMFLVTTTDRLEQTLRECVSEWNYRLCAIALIDEDQIGRVIHLEDYRAASSKSRAEKGDAVDADDAVPVVATYYNMYSYAQSHAVDEVYINVPYHTGKSTFQAAMQFEKMGVNVHVSLELLNHFEGCQKSIGMVYGDPVVTFSNHQYDWRTLVAKRLMDIAGGIVGLLITAVATVILAIPLLIESPGPLFFGQNRVGKNGRIFKMYKFRSMYKDAEERKKELMAQNEMGGPMFKMKDDPRITKVGKFIRATSIDELPQFWNVLKGDMSLVGTRPPTVDEFEQYEASQKRRLSAKPGITGLWQVSGRNDISDFEDVVKMDLEYIDNWSLMLDVKILFKTVLVVLKRGGE
ncbi:MAG: sugar transferase [Lachnospiraceae bacterium]|nr:sugar transferase [Lachnospiraceae bacterium]